MDKDQIAARRARRVRDKRVQSFNWENGPRVRENSRRSRSGIRQQVRELTRQFQQD